MQIASYLAMTVRGNTPDPSTRGEVITTKHTRGFTKGTRNHYCMIANKTTWVIFPAFGGVRGGYLSYVESRRCRADCPLNPPMGEFL